MTPTTLLEQPLCPPRPHAPRTSSTRCRASLLDVRGGRASQHPSPRERPPARRLLAGYTDLAGRLREVLAQPGRVGSVLVIDRDAATRGDRRLVAHLAADEPTENAILVCRLYLRDARGRRCRRLTPEDLHMAPFCEENVRVPAQTPATPSGAAELLDRHGCLHRLEAVAAGLSIPEVRWCRRTDAREEPESVRDAVGCLESYEPLRALTRQALARHREDSAVSVAVLRAELLRLDASRIVLNRGLRRAVLRAMRIEEVSLSEIAFRCGRVKHDGRGRASGETSWLARRIGLAPESGGDGRPTPWVHSEVLALIAREGLGVSPHEVEL